MSSQLESIVMIDRCTPVNVLAYNVANLSVLFAEWTAIYRKCDFGSKR